LFIIGAARSGTTLLGDCIAALPEISYHFEPVATKAAARYVAEGRWSERRARQFYRLVYAWLMRMHLDGDLRFAEKTPRNSCIVGFLDASFPAAQFVHIVRDGRDAALSHSKRPWLSAALAGSGAYEPGGYPLGPYAQFWVEPGRRNEFEATSDLHRCAWAWRRLTENALADCAHLPDDRYLELRYESLVTQPDGEAERVLDFLRIQRTASRDAFRGAVVRTARSDSVGRWRTELSESELAVITSEAGALLRRLGYA
jgi:hypothetical protein